MSIYKSNNGKFCIELSNISADNSNGSQMLEYRINVSSHGFSVSTDGIWFYQEDLLEFCKKIDAIASGSRGEISVAAMSDFILTVSPKDGQGHFIVKAKVVNQFYGNQAEIFLELETQTLLDMARDLASSSQL